jgi:hypothetical protein
MYFYARCIMRARKARNTPSKQPFPFSDLVGSPEHLLEDLAIRPSGLLFQGALSQLELGLVDLAELANSLANCREYMRLLRWGYLLMSNTLSTADVIDTLHKVAFQAVAAGWMAHQAAAENSLLERLVRGTDTRQATDGSGSGREAAEQ